VDEAKPLWLCRAGPLDAKERLPAEGQCAPWAPLAINPLGRRQRKRRPDSGRFAIVTPVRQMRKREKDRTFSAVITKKSVKSSGEEFTEAITWALSKV
jgi:hypothetical protein